LNKETSVINFKPFLLIQLFRNHATYWRLKNDPKRIRQTSLDFNLLP
jgi:hypothetical protein